MAESLSFNHSLTHGGLTHGGLAHGGLTHAALAASALDAGALPSDASLRDHAILVEALKNCEQWAFESLVAQYQHPVYNLIYRLLPDASECPDVVQEVFLKVFRNIHGFRADASLKTWIYRIAVNEAHNHRRWFSRHKKLEVGFEGDHDDDRDLGELLVDHEPTPLDRLSSQQMREEIESALVHLKPIFREAVVLRDIEEMSYEEIAAVLGISLGTVKSRIMRGRLALESTLREARGRAEALHQDGLKHGLMTHKAGGAK